MLFMLMASDVADSTEARLAARSAHLARLEKLAEAGRLVLAGPCPLPEGETGFSGSLIVADFASLDEAEEWAGQDPYVEAGVYARLRKCCLHERANHPSAFGSRLFSQLARTGR